MTIFKIVVLALVVWGIHSTLWLGWQRLRNEHWNAGQLRPAWLVAAGACYLLGQLGPGWFWWRLLHWLGQPARPLETLRAYYIGHIGKYAPGKAMVIVLRAALLRGGGTTATAATVAVFFETLTTMAIGAAVAFIILVALRQQLMLILIAAALWAVVSAPTNPAVFRWLVRYTGAGKLDPAMAEKLVHIRYGSLAACWLPVATAWPLMGLSLWATARAAGFHTQFGLSDEIAFCTAAAGMSVVVGFISFLPGGLGARDLSLVPMLTPLYQEDGALIVSIVSRLVWIVAELTLAGPLYVSFRRPWKPRPGTTESGDEG